MMEIEFWGVRGSIPVPGPATVRYGGNTSCVSVRVAGHWVVFDAGTGIRRLGERLHKEANPGTIQLFLSHVHWDHIQGFPFFSPAFRKDRCLRVYGMERQDGTLSEILEGQMEGPNFPVSLSQMGADIQFRDLREGAIYPLYDADDVAYASVACGALHHPNGALAYRLAEVSSGRSVVYATDTEHFGDHVDETLVNLSRDADVLIYDCTYTPEEYPDHRGWGHSTWKEGFKVARAAGVKCLVVFHHDPSHDDDFMDALRERVLREAQAMDPSIRVVFAQEGLTLDPSALG